MFVIRVVYPSPNWLAFRAIEKVKSFKTWSPYREWVLRYIYLYLVKNNKGSLNRNKRSKVVTLR
jgi:hypothetical protein